MSLKIKAINGIIWVSISKVLLKIINFVITIVLARLLAPTDFGLVALALVFVNFFEITRDIGMESALIQKEGKDSEKDLVYNTAFILYPSIALLLYLISYSIAPYAAYFFGNPDVEVIMKVLLTTIVIWSFGTLPRTLLIKNLEFKKMLLPQIIPRLSYGFTTIVLAYLGYGVWSLIAGRIFLEIASVIVYWKSLKWRPSFEFSPKKAKELFSFGKFVMVSSILLFLISSIDITIIGKLLDTEQLGYYTISLSIAGLFTVQIAAMISQVMFPTYSKLQNDINKMKEAHIHTIRLYSLFVVPASWGIIAIAWYFIEVVYGDKWLPAVPILQILCIYGLFSSYTKINSTIFLAVGKPKILTTIYATQLLGICILIYPLTTKYGIIGTSFAIMIPAIFSSAYSFIESNRLLKNTLFNSVRSLYPSIQSTLIMLIALYLLSSPLSTMSSEIALVANIIGGMITYICSLILLNRNFIKDNISSIPFKY